MVGPDFTHRRLQIRQIKLPSICIMEMGIRDLGFVVEDDSGGDQFCDDGGDTYGLTWLLDLFVAG